MSGLQEITQLAERLTTGEQLALVEHLAHRLRSKADLERKPIDLYGAWKGKFPEDIDVLSDLRDIRNDWKDRLEKQDVV